MKKYGFSCNIKQRIFSSAVKGKNEGEKIHRYIGTSAEFAHFPKVKPTHWDRVAQCSQDGSSEGK